MNSDARYARLTANLCGFAAALMLLVLATSAFIRIEHNGCTNIAFPATLTLMSRAMHRVSASSVGLLLIAISFFVLRCRPVVGSRNVLLALLWVLTVFLAVLGRFTSGSVVPAVVIGNVIGGMALAALFWRLRLEFVPRESYQRPERALSKLASTARSVAAFQVWIGSWVAGLIAEIDCKALTSAGKLALWPDVATWKALNPTRIYSAGNADLLRAVNWLSAVHVAVALVLLATVVMLCGRLRHSGGGLNRTAPVLLALLALQLLLGMATIIAGRAVLIGVLHNIVAALLLVKLIDVDYRLHRS
ncbi:COX15/CtaA family protein [Noviherbaspirillum sp.]|uniref:COX15/CtaA family protein n=1 Tax=Noviherbaspirillum sp. TaxID=1926288 RepID=UPI002B45C55D|nr:COX15/CtaA family protein [Noviherbaspirillum sp.]HJV79630.1 COX15/CtaA family protein [Noviherbaspirillum sp.]